jgi:hypothetical protein
MPKTADQRLNDIAKGGTWAFADNWTTMTSTIQKDLSAPIFKRDGDVAGMAKRLDVAQAKFKEFRDKKENARKLFDTSQLLKFEAQEADLRKELDDIQMDASQTIKSTAGGTVDDMMESWEEALKATQDEAKERKAVFDNWIKADAAACKTMSDIIGKVHKEITAANDGLKSTNAELNSLEAEVRAAIVRYEKTALDMNRKDIADKVRKYLTVFS